MWGGGEGFEVGGVELWVRALSLKLCRDATPQEMAVGIIGLCLGMLLAHAVAGSSQGAFAAFGVLTCLHLWCNYRAVCSVRLTSVSDERLGVMVSDGWRVTRDV